MKTMDDNVIVQVGVAVENIEETAKRLADIFGMEVPDIMDIHENKEEYINYYKGRKTESYTKTCYFHMGQVDLELVQPVGKNIDQREFLDKKGHGVHHIAFNVKKLRDKADHLEKKGLKIVQETKFPGGFSSLLYCPELGFDIELLEGATKPDSDKS